MVATPKFPCTWTVDVKRFFIETAEKNGKGNAVSVPVTIRKMFVTDPRPITDSGHYRIVLRNRNTYDTRVVVGPRGGRKTVRTVIGRETTYSLSALPRIPQSIWTNPSGRAESWYKVGTEYKRTDDKPFTEAEFLRWLTVRMGEAQAKLALLTLQTQEPTPADGEFDTDEVSEAA
jgi:hypothetical protein